MKIPGLDAAAGDNSNLRMALTFVQEYLTQLEEDLGVNPFASQQAKKRQHIEPPPLVPFSVDGVDGNFVVTVSIPEEFVSAANLYHQVRTSTDVPFGDDAFTAEAISGGTIVIPDPGVTKWVALRSRFQDSAFNSWVIFPTQVTT